MTAPPDYDTAGDVPESRIQPELFDTVDSALAALAGHAPLFQRSGMLVHVVRDAAPPTGVTRSAGSPSIRQVQPALLREMLSRCARFVRVDRRKRSARLVRVLPPNEVVSSLLARDQWAGIRPLVGIIEAPALRADGTIIQRAGYDSTSGYLYLPSTEYPEIPESPTRDDAVRARDDLLEVVQDFPFATPAHRAAWLALLLTLFARPALDGCVPLGAIDATTRGTGKGRLADATAIIATGREATKTPLPQDDEEMRKRISSLILEGETLAVLDNVSAPLAFSSLDAALTATTWKDRALGKMATFSAPNLLAWFVTGNNLQLGADTARRTLHIRLESPLEHPEDRADFAHPDLLGWVRRERPRLVVAALTLLRAWIVAGRPSEGCKAWGSFEAWSRLVAPAVVWVGLPDPMDTRAELEAVADTTRSALVALVDGLARLATCGGMTAKAIIGALYPPPSTPNGFEEMREAIEELAPPLPGKPPSATKLGYQLRHFRRRVVGGRMLDGRPVQGVMRWQVRSVEAPRGDDGDRGDVSNPSRGECEDKSDITDAHVPTMPPIPTEAGPDDPWLSY